MSDRVLEHLARLVACNTENPPRDIVGDHPVFQYVRSVLPGDFAVEVTDHGDGHVSFQATRGEPEVLFNVHLDTVPVGNGWTRPPLELTLDDGRAYGRGACDIKGAAAVLLDLAQATDAPMALLFTTDEEGAHGCCVKRYVAGIDPARWSLVVVAEPTGCQAVLGHRGYLSVVGEFQGHAGHSSEARGLEDNALHKLGTWMAGALALARDADACFNVGRVEGGIKSNVIADRARLNWSARLPPGVDDQAFFERITGGARDASWQQPFSGPPLPAPGRSADAAADRAGELGWPEGSPVDFWTEASLFSAGGLPALVLGPGDIAQAHTADEWVVVKQLRRARELYSRVIGHG